MSEPKESNGWFEDWSEDADLDQAIHIFTPNFSEYILPIEEIVTEVKEKFPIPCLCCNKEFLSVDVKRNRICSKCQKSKSPDLLSDQRNSSVVVHIKDDVLDSLFEEKEQEKDP